MSTLEGPRRAAKSGSATSLAILLRGYGADGNDQIGLADPLAEHLPDTVFVAPNAPSPCAVNPSGYQWFPIPWMDGSSEVEMGQGFAAAAAALDGYLDTVAVAEGIGPEKTVLIGFSQGTMMSLHVAPRRTDPIAGIVGFSGRLLHPGSLAAEAVSKPPVLLIHGDADQVVPYTSMPEAEMALKGAGFSVETHTSAGIGHGIGPDGRGRALGFMQGVLA